MTSYVLDKITRFLDRKQQAELSRDTGHGYCTTKQIAQSVGLEKAEAREVLERAAAAGVVRRNECSNGVFWRSTTPLPWEPGGAVYERSVRDAEIERTHPKVVVVQAGNNNGPWYDIERFAEAHADRADAMVRSKNAANEARRREQRFSGETILPTYRMVRLNTEQPS